ILGKTNGDLVITNEQIGKKKVRPIQTTIEKDLVYPIVKPRHVKKWLMKGYKYIIIPQKKQGENNESEVLTTNPKTYAYLQTFRDDLLGRSSRWFKGGDKPFYSLFGIGVYTFAPFKVVWSSIGFLHAFAVVSTVTDEFIGTKEVIPDNTIGYLSFEAEQEAHYTCAILNSNVIREMFSRRSTKSKWGISISMVKHVPIPPYNPDNPVHRNLAALSRQAHELARSSADTSDIERQVNLIVPECLNSL
ncbi:MAG TPA: hypothetical protein VKK79_10880, partial [Candidatus Lokiarchaeia archaeon]|nr:hypothetical protein [Candidatus Lokiarchaeia archaeon]